MKRKNVLDRLHLAIASVSFTEKSIPDGQPTSFYDHNGPSKQKVEHDKKFIESRFFLPVGIRLPIGTPLLRAGVNVVDAGVGLVQRVQRIAGFRDPTVFDVCEGILWNSLQITVCY
jgi:hypothetical protein